MMPGLPLCSRLSGFSLVQVSLLLTIGALVMVSVLPGADSGDYNQKSINTVKKIERIEEAARAFMVRNGRRPCPADGQYAISNANFGIEAATPGTCTGGAPAAPFGPDIGTGNVIGGVVPTKSLNLPDDYAFDDWGRRITYIVDKRATLMSTCLTLENAVALGGSSGISIKSTSGGSTLATSMAAYISHGADGHGAFPIQGSTVANRINTGSSDADTLVNAGVDNTFTYNTTNFTSIKIQKTKTATFDDIVYVRKDLKDECCMGMICNPVGFRIDGYTNGASASHLTLIGTGDIDGDGKKDIVAADYAFNKVYVIYGRTKANSTDIAVANLLGASTGFAITNVNGQAGYLYGSIADINNDGYYDILIAAWNREYIVFGGPKPWPNSFNASSLNGYTGTNGTSGVIITPNVTVSAGADWISAPSIYSTDVNNDTYPDIFVAGQTSVNGASAGYVIFGKPNTGGVGNNDWQHTATVDTGTLDGTNGFQIVTSTDTTAATKWDAAGAAAAGKFDGDVYGDIFINAYHSYSDAGSLFVIYGRQAGGGVGQWPTGSPAQIDLTAELGAGTASRLYDSYATSPYTANLFRWAYLADVTADGTLDLLAGNSSTPLYIVPGGARLAASYDINTHVGVGGVKRIRANNALNLATFNLSYTVGDINRDGNQDIVVACRNCAYNSRTDSGSAFVFLGPVSGWGSDTSAATDWTYNGTSAFRVDGAETDDKVSASAVVDVSGDGKVDLIVNAPYSHYGRASGAANTTGAIYVYFGSSSLPWSSTVDLNDIN